MSDIISVIGLGYVGLPLAVEFAKKYDVIGFDINNNRIDQLNKGIDITNEITSFELNEVTNRLIITSDITKLSK